MQALRLLPQKVKSQKRFIFLNSILKKPLSKFYLRRTVEVHQNGFLNLQKKLATNTQFGENDSFWIVIDRDQWEISELADVRRQCVQSRFNLLVSNPCFEIWLSFHCSNYPTSNSCKNDAVLALREDLGGYRGTKYDAKSLINKAALACDRAESLDDHQNEIFPQNPGSRVYQLVRHLLAN